MASIHLHTLEHLEARPRPRRLNLFTGRAMSETAFDKAQSYIADRISPLLSGVWPGILDGLEVRYLSVAEQLAASGPRRIIPGRLLARAYASQQPAYPTLPGSPTLPHPNVGSQPPLVSESTLPITDTSLEPLFKIKAGSGVTAQGEVVKLFQPLQVSWSDLLERSNLTTQTGGLYMLALSREVIPVDYNEARACRRREEDPSRDRRFETVGVLQLLPVSDFAYSDNDLLPDNRHRTINRFLSTLVEGRQPPQLPTDQVTLGLLAADAELPLWFEANGCRFSSLPIAYPLALLSHSEQVFNQLLQQNANLPSDQQIANINQSVKQLFINLPAAGSMPRLLLQNVSNIDPPLPSFGIDYPGLRVDMLPIPESGVPGLLRRELARGVIPLSNASEQRLRLLIAVPDADYHPKLLDVPRSDAILSQQLYQHSITAYDQWRAWRSQLNSLFNQNYSSDYLDNLSDNQLNSEELTALGLPDLNASRFAAPLLPREVEFDTSNPPTLPSDYSPHTFFESLINRRGSRSSAVDYRQLPPPYREGVPESSDYDTWLGNGLPSPEETQQPGLVIRHAELKKDIDAREEELEQTRSYIDKISDLMLLQRQQLDAQSLSYATLAGGVAGDGSGLQLTRWLPYTKFSVDTSINTPTTSRVTAPLSAPITNSLKTTATTANSSLDAKLALQESSLGTLAATANLGELTLSPITINPATSVQLDGGALTSLTDNQAYLQLATANLTTSNYEAINGLSANLSKLDLVPLKTAPLTTASFQTANFKFGVMQHISVINTELNNSHSSVHDLQDEIEALIDEIETFIAKLPESISQVLTTSLSYSRRQLPTLPVLQPKDPQNPTEEDDRILEANRYNTLFQTSKVLYQEIHSTESARNQLARIQKALQRHILDQQKALQELEQRILDTRRTLAQLDAVRREALEDYVVAQQLVIEHWQQVEAKFDQRNKVLEAMSGLYYVKVRETATSLSLPDTTSLAYAERGDLVPGCRGDETIALPDDLSPFMAAVLEIPMQQWQPLSPLHMLLPTRLRLQELLEQRGDRLESKRRLLSKRTAPNPGLRGLLGQTQRVMQSFSQRQSPFSSSLLQLQLESAKQLSLDDLLNGAASRLRSPAQKLSRNLELASHCLLQQLHTLPASIRLEWSQLAEGDQLPIDTPQRWPSITSAEGAAFNALRTTLALVDWFNRQLIPQAESDSRTALRNLLRACLMVAAGDDPDDILQGQLQIAPGLLQLGSVLRLSLNREAPPGASLQLFDAQQQLVASLRLDDQDSNGASATITRLFMPTLDNRVNTEQFNVIGHRYR